jgi:hypothetical protein
MTADAGLGIIRPRYGDASLADVMPSVLAALAVPGAPDPLGFTAGPLAGVRAVVVLLVDGLGHHLLPLAASFAPTLTELARAPGSRGITTGFPSTTPTSLASLGTGAAPGAHGLVGFFLNVPGTDIVLNHIRWDGEPDPLRWQPLATQFDVAEAAGVAARVVSKPEFRHSGLTTAAFRGGRYRGAGDADAVATEVLALLGTQLIETRGASVSGRTVIYAYHPDVDRAGHEFGVDSPQWREAVTTVDTMVHRIWSGLGPGQALVVTADHGQLNIPARRRFDLDSDPRLREGVRVVAGEPRVRYLHTVDGATADVLAAWREVLGPAASVLYRDEAVAEGWFGPVPEEHLQRIGDVVAICHADYVVLATKTDPPTVEHMVAFHGSSTEAEMMIPLLVARP